MTIVRLICIACWITNATNVLAEYVIFITFHSKHGYANEPQCYIYTYFAFLVITSAGLLITEVTFLLFLDVQVTVHRDRFL